MAEYFHYFLPIHHLFDKSVHISQVFLLSLEVFPGQPREYSRYLQHNERHGKGNDSQRNIQDEHGYQRRYKRCRRVDDLRDALAEQLSQCIYIVCVH